MPCVTASCGERMETRRPRISIVPPWISSAPKIARAVSVLPGPHQPRDAEDFSLAEIEAHIPYQPPRIELVHPKDHRRIAGNAAF